MAIAQSAPKYKAQPPKKGARAGAKASEEETSQDQPSDTELRRALLEQAVWNRLREAKAARENSGIEEIWRESEVLYNGEDPNNPMPLVKTRDKAARATGMGGRATVVLNITKPKTDVAVSRVQEMLVPNDDKPWAAEPTPIPEFAEAAKDTGGGQVQLADGTMVVAAKVAQYMIDQAKKAAEGMSTWIEDKFVEGGVYAEMRAVIRDAGRLGSGVLKGPVPIARKDRKWITTKGIGKKPGTAKLQINIHIEPTSRRIRPQDLFPDPACGDDIHAGSYCADRDFLTPRKLRELAGLPDYDRDAIIAALKEGPMRGIKQRSESGWQLTPGEAVSEASLYEVYYYYGDVDPDDLVALGLPANKMGEDEAVLGNIPAIVTMLNGRAIKATVNPLDTGEFPYDVFPWEPVDGQPWGRGVPWKMAVAQRGLTAAVRALNENAGLSSGPQIAITNGVLTPVDGKYEIVGRKLWKFDPTDLIKDINHAMAVFEIPSRQEELLNIIRFYLEMADQLTNLPMLLHGEQQAGTSPETLGGMKLLVQNATSALRTIAKLFDDRLVTRHLQRYYDWGMGDPNVPQESKGDVSIKARGATVLVQREEAREFLAQLFQVKDDPTLRIDPSKLIQEFSRANGFDLSVIQYTEDEWAKKVEEAKANPPPGDPRIEAAHIRNDGIKQKAQADVQMQQAEQQWKADQAERDRQHKLVLEEAHKVIEQMRLAATSGMSLEQIKADLAKAAMTVRTQREKMQLDVATPHQGI